MKGRSALRVGNSKVEGNLWNAAFHGDVETVEYLVNVRCVPPDVRNRWGQTALHCACREGRERVVMTLLKSGARVWLKEQDLCTPLHLAAFFGHTTCVQLLLQYGASVTALNAFGQTPLEEADGQARGVVGPRGDGPRKVAVLLKEALEVQTWERSVARKQCGQLNPTYLVQAARDVYDEWDSPEDDFPVRHRYLPHEK
eukprot:SAG11_NODE_12803_length_684_cov_1.297436_1_plen_198_part_01